MKTKKIIIAKVPKPKKYDLSFTKKEENTKILVALESLKVNTGWHFLTQVISANIDFLSKQIITKRGEDGNTLSDQDVDLLRFKHNYLSEFLNKPDSFIKMLQRTDDSAVDNLDPYFSKEDKT